MNVKLPKYLSPNLPKRYSKAGGTAMGDEESGRQSPDPDVVDRWRVKRPVGRDLTAPIAGFGSDFQFRRQQETRGD